MSLCLMVGLAVSMAAVQVQAFQYSGGQLPDSIQADEPLEYRASDAWQSPRSGGGGGTLASPADLLYFPPAGRMMMNSTFAFAYFGIKQKDATKDLLKMSAYSGTLEAAYAFNPFLAFGLGVEYAWAELTTPAIDSDSLTESLGQPSLMLHVNMVPSQLNQPISVQARVAVGLPKVGWGRSSINTDGSTTTTSSDVATSVEGELSVAVKASRMMQMGVSATYTKVLKEKAQPSFNLDGQVQLAMTPDFRFQMGLAYNKSSQDDAKGLVHLGFLSLSAGVQAALQQNTAVYLQGLYGLNHSFKQNDKTLQDDIKTRSWGLGAGLRLTM